MEQESVISESTLETSRLGGGNMGARGNNESSVSVTFLFRYEFRGRNYFKGERAVTPQIIP